MRRRVRRRAPRLFRLTRRIVVAQRRSNGVHHTNSLFPAPSGNLLRPTVSTASHHPHHHHHHHHPSSSSPSPSSSSGTSNEGFQFEEAYKRGTKHVEKKDYKRAVSEFSEAISISPNKLKAYIQRANCYVNTGRFQPAIDDYSTVIAMTPSNPEMLAKRAHAFEKIQRFPDAIADYSSAIELSATPSKLRDLHLARGRVHVAMNNLVAALDDFAAAVTLDPRADVAFHERALVFAKMKKFDLALADFDHVVKIEEKSGRLKQDSLLHRAHMHLRLADDEERTHLADVATASTEAGLTDVSSAAAIFQGCVLVGGDRDDLRGTPYTSSRAITCVHLAVQDLTLALEMDPQSVALLEERGDSYLRMGDFHNALVDLNAALAHDPKNASLLLLRAMVYKHQDAHTVSPLTRALAQATKVIELSTQAHEAYFCRARLHVEGGALDQAVEDLSAIVQMFEHALVKKDETNDETKPPLPPYAFEMQPNPVDIAVRALLCRARLFLHQHTEEMAKAAIQDYQRIVDVCPNHLDAQMERQAAQEMEEKIRTDRMDQAYNWLLEHGNDQSKESSPEMKKQRKKKKKAKKAAETVPSLSLEAVDALPPPSVAPEAPAQPEPVDHVVTEPPEVVAPPPAATTTSTPPPVVVTAEKPPLAAPKPPTPNRRLTSNGPPAVVTRDEACESMFETEKDAEEMPRVATGRSSSPMRFHFSLVDDNNSSGAVGSTAATPATTTTDDNGSVDDDYNSVELTGDKNSTTPPSPMSAILMDERYLKKRQKQLEKLRADLIDVCERREIDAITSAIDRATRKQMADQLVDEIDMAKELLEVLKSEPKETAKDKDAATTTDDDEAAEETTTTASQDDELNEDDSTAVPAVATAVATVAAPSATTITTTSMASPEKRKATPKSASPSPHRKSSQQNSPSKSPPRSPPDNKRVLALQAQLDALQQEYALFRMDLDRLQQTTQAPAIATHPGTQQPALNYNLTVPFTHKLQAMERCMRPLNSAVLGCPALRQVDAMIDHAFGPTSESERVRAKILRYLRFVLDQSQCLYPCTPSGSYPLKTYLPDSDIDVCLEVPDPAAVATWHSAITQALIGAATLDLRYSPQTTDDKSPSCTVRNVTFINAEVRVVKCTIDNVSIDFTANRFGALGALALLDEMDARVGQSHLFKRTLILVKAWAMYDSCRFIPGHQRSNILGAVSGALSTFALNTMVMCLFNLYGKRIVHPLQGLMEFLHHFADFDWQYNAVSLYGPVPIGLLNSGGAVKCLVKDVLVDDAFVDTLKTKVANVHVELKPSLPFQIRACNVVDPLNEMNNVARSVTADKLTEMKQAFQGARQALVDLFFDGWQSAEYHTNEQDVQAEDILAHVEHIDSVLFANGMQMYGSGWRPDLLVHPRQIWHGPMLGASSAAGDGDGDVLQTQVPEFLR
ncbi:Aste57867_21590 [Aphanomyces stellatus]|uniref:Aste57867_21590 protein n=1 Tax=Aphanomyces stellatus TaxID=120398 RepID=A0A485LHY1_9STRA|nr:hypothetical protein As57867_021521 [Aphanomyces stellatus]VFT98260.1 Aste57867_21590 [Aphanomyces stellatus]